MLEEQDLDQLLLLVRRGCSDNELRRAAAPIRMRLNPHPAGQLDLNVPLDPSGSPLPGTQHKYANTLLIFPSHGQTCHAFCTYCFRWAQFIGDQSLKFATDSIDDIKSYVLRHPEITDILITGGDPMVMSAERLEEYVSVFLDPRLESIETIRIGTKSLAYWPYRFTTDPDAGRLVGVLESVSRAGRHLAIMAHYTHPCELEPEPARDALHRVQETGATVYCQAPVVAHVNDNADVLAELWRSEARLGCVPYYLFVERDTGARRYFEIPLTTALDLYRGAIAQLSGLARTVRGPVMSAAPGKIVIDGTAEVAGEAVFALRFLQGRCSDWVGRPFFARLDREATWFDDLSPIGGDREFFFEPEFRELRARRVRESGARPDGPSCD